MLAYLHRHINSVWLCLVALVLGLLLLFPDWLTRDSISACLAGLGSGALLVYLLMCMTRSLLMIPVTPFVLAGAVTFPDLLMLVFGISLAGIVVGAFLIYSFPAFGGYDRLLEEKYPAKIALLKKNMHGNRSFWIIAGWSFFPLVPTDLICYVAGMVRLPFRKVVGPLMVGEIPLVTIYVYLGSEFGDWLRI